MSRFLLDTNIPSELTRPEPEPRVIGWIRSINEKDLFLSVITLGEIRKGLALLPDGKRRIQLANWFEEDLRPWFAGRILPVDEQIAEKWGMLDGGRQLSGAPLNTADGLIAATAISHGLTLVTRNGRDFSGLGVPVFDPWS